ncbi:MAG: C69 family dipeptidase [Chloroflexi bacterium]|nr:C69 family dipeptidase [Chloroflexota bacterium]
MSKTRSVFFGVIFSLFLFSVLPFRFGPAESQPFHPHFNRQPGSELRCTTILIGKDASPDGSVLLAHNEDLGNYCAQHYLTVARATHEPGEEVILWSGARLPQVTETNAYIATTIFDIEYLPGDITSGINEYQVAVANNLASQRNAVRPYPRKGRIIWSEFSRLVLERAKTAREAVQLVGDLAQIYKLGLDPGTMFGVTDTAEGWWIEIAQEGQWVASRVPDNGAEMRANAYRIGVVDFDDAENFMYSPDVVSYARMKGWYHEGDGPFNFALVYGDPVVADGTWNTHRQERVEDLLNQYQPHISLQNLMSILRDHYEGTPYDLTNGYELGSPHQTSEYTLCNLTTELGVICQSRSWLPAEIGAVCWRAMSTPCTSVFVPWYMGQLSIPTAYQTGTNHYSIGSAYWAFRKLSEAVDPQYGATIEDVQSRWKNVENKEFAVQPLLEAMALQLYGHDPTAARRLLSAQTNAWALWAVSLAQQLPIAISTAVICTTALPA